MNAHRILIEKGMANALHGMDYQKAAMRAIENAMRHSTLPIFETTGLSHTDMRVQVTVGVQDPAQLDTTALAACLPRGQATVTATHGGHKVHNPQTGDTAVIATAAIEAFLPDQSSRWRLTR